MHHANGCYHVAHNSWNESLADKRNSQFVPSCTVLESMWIGAFQHVLVCIGVHGGLAQNASEMSKGLLADMSILILWAFAAQAGAYRLQFISISFQMLSDPSFFGHSIFPSSRGLSWTAL